MSVKDRAFEIGRVALTSAAFAGVLSCGDGSDTQNQGAGNNTTSTRTAEVGLGTEKDISSKITAEAQRQGLTVQQQVTVPSTIGKPNTEVTNYIPNTTLNIESAIEIIKSVETVIGATPQLPITIDGQDKVLLFGPAKTITRSSVILIPKDNTIVVPGVLDPTGNGHLRPGYSILTLDGESASVLRKTSNQLSQVLSDEYEFLTVPYAVEACQRVTHAVILEKSGRTVLTPESLRFAQELACNSVGYLVSFAALGIPYQQYADVTGKRSLSFGPGYKPAAAGKYPYLVFSEEVYNLFRHTGPIIVNSN